MGCPVQMFLSLVERDLIIFACKHCKAMTFCLLRHLFREISSLEVSIRNCKLRHHFRGNVGSFSIGSAHLTLPSSAFYKSPEMKSRPPPHLSDATTRITLHSVMRSK